MKKADLAMIGLIAVTSVMIAFFITKGFIGGASTQAVKVKTIEKISPDIEQPDTAIFNSDAINPAVEVQITPGKK